MFALSRTHLWLTLADCAARACVRCASYIHNTAGYALVPLDPARKIIQRRLTVESCNFFVQEIVCQRSVRRTRSASQSVGKHQMWSRLEAEFRMRSLEKISSLARFYFFIFCSVDTIWARHHSPSKFYCFKRQPTRFVHEVRGTWSHIGDVFCHPHRNSLLIFARPYVINTQLGSCTVGDRCVSSVCGCISEDGMQRWIQACRLAASWIIKSNSDTAKTNRVRKNKQTYTALMSTQIKIHVDMGLVAQTICFHPLFPQILHTALGADQTLPRILGMLTQSSTKNESTLDPTLLIEDWMAVWPLEHGYCWFSHSCTRGRYPAFCSVILPPT